MPRTSENAMPLHQTPLPGAIMSVDEEEKLTRPDLKKQGTDKPDMIDQADHNQTIPI